MPADNIRGSAQEHLNDEISAWMSANYGDGILAPLTGTDWRAMRALVYAWDLWLYVQSPAAFRAAVDLLRCMQRTTRDLGVSIIPMIGDWSHEIHMRSMLRPVLDLPGISPEPMQRVR